jgi:hypothetical protein
VFVIITGKVKGLGRIITYMAKIAPYTQREGKMMHHAIQLFFSNVLGQYLEILITGFVLRKCGKRYDHTR